ncbi:unnamed protein product [Cyprideis torosa]|uniref:Uncharacterized protein n=1 Tax=Cyprideis torosa TaxID=163714 RepID=A0A7R8ZKP8_9CRUS|nr:unnamed protein product [Cyprideis torosa]CAG0882076.1 unnamed protein product [Cyprideis torosa]
MRASSLLTPAFILLLAHLAASEDVVDGRWSEWGTLHSSCSVTCGGGTVTEHRSCSDPPPRNGGKECEGNSTRQSPCNTDPCGDPCTFLPNKEKPYRDNCPLYAQCEDQSTDYEAKAACVCILGYELNKAKDACIRPMPPPPTPRPIPTLKPEIKTVVTIITTSASSIILVFLGITLGIFILLRIFTRDRVIQMNMEIALAGAHICLLFPLDTSEDETLCRIISILIHFFFTSCFMFMFLEAVHMYSLVAYVVKKDGMFSSIQNIIIGWGIAGIVVTVTMCFAFKGYGSEYMCWLQLNMTGVTLGSYIPVCCLTILTLILIEAAGNSDNYKKLPEMDKAQLFSAKVSQRFNLAILLLVLVTFILGTFAYYEMDPGLYGSFSTCNAILGAVIFIGHTMGNEIVSRQDTGLRSRTKNSSTPNLQAWDKRCP